MRPLIIADKQDITRIGIKTIASNIQKFNVLEEANTKHVLIDILARYPRALVILDYTLFDFNEPSELLILRDKFQHSDWIIFAEDLSDNLLKQLTIDNNSFSIILKSNSIEEITSALVYTVNGERFICNRVTNHLLMLNKPSIKSDKTLTNGEQEILKAIAMGKTTKEIAFDRNLSFHTVMTHRKNIFRKLEVNNAHEAIKYAIKAGIADVSEYYI